jgi:hypothetical protein
MLLLLLLSTLLFSRALQESRGTAASDQVAVSFLVRTVRLLAHSSNERKKNPNHSL